MSIVKNILDAKEAKVYSISPDATVYEALEVLVENKIGVLPVMEGDSLIGIFSERDFIRKVSLQRQHTVDTPVRDIMTKNVITVTPESGINECMNIMTDMHIRHLPVLKNNRVIGIVSIGDLVKCIIEEQKFIIENLEGYIVGAR